jgi:hypothetical protein
VPEHSAPFIYSSNFVINALEHVLTEENRIKVSNNLFEILHPLSEGIYTDRQSEESAGLVRSLFDGTFLFGKA